VNQSNETIPVKAGVVCGKKLTLYLADGQIKEIDQGNPNVQTILDLIIGPCSRGQTVHLSVDLLKDRKVDLGDFTRFEKKSPFVRFVNVARSALGALQKLFAEPAELKDQTIGQIPTQNTPASNPAPTREEIFASQVKEVMTHAVPVVPDDLKEPTHDRGDDPVEDRSTTLVAVTPEGILPNAQALAKVISHNVATGEKADGILKLIERVTKVAKERQHSAEDFVGFLQKSDLAVADDGSVLAYKILNYKTTKDGVRYFVDCHTNRVIQRVGSLVRMDPKLVDPNRRKDCSNGLHVARRGYLRQFNGSACVLLRVLPEDAIAVPAYNRDKMRVCAYQIIFELPRADMDRVRADKPVMETSTLAALQAAKEGKFPDPVEIVEITGHSGSGLKITQLKDGKPVTEMANQDGEARLKEVEQTADKVHAAVEAQSTGSIVSNEDVAAAEAMAEANGDNPVASAAIIPDSVTSEVVADKENTAPVVDPLTVARQVKDTKASTPSREQVAKALWEVLNKTPTAANAQALRDYKRKTKISWERLGLDATKVEAKLAKIGKIK
jgi:hypothetical protein